MYDDEIIDRLKEFIRAEKERAFQDGYNKARRFFEQKKPKPKKFEVGDQVKNNYDEIYVATYVDDEMIEGISKDGRIHFNYLDEVEKTGHRFETILKKRFEAEEGE